MQIHRIDAFRHLLAEGEALAMMTPEVIFTLADHAQANLRRLMIVADGLLVAAAEREAPRIDECAFSAQPSKAVAAGRRR